MAGSARHVEMGGDVDKAELFHEARADRTGPIEGLRALECTTTWAGPMAGCALGDLGADVIKVELPEGEISRQVAPFLPGTDLSFMHETVNRNKRCLTLDLHTDDGRELYLAVAATADVVVENFLPGTLDRWGVGYEAVRATWPACTPPLSALAALRHRDATGEGQRVDISMLDALLFQSNGYLRLGAVGHDPEPWGAALQFCVPGNAYRCADGRYVYPGTILSSHWARLCELMGRPELAEAPGFANNTERVANREAVDGLVASWCLTQRSEELVAALQAAGLAATMVNEYRDLVKEAHVAEREMLVDVELCDGTTMPLTGPAAKFSRTPTSIRRAAPALGQHTAEVLAEVGVGAERYPQLRLEGVV